MKIKCIFVDGSKLSNEFQSIGFDANTEFDIKPDSIFTVYGVCYWQKVILYLIVDSTNLPNWYPSELFTVVDRRLPERWEFLTYYEKGKYAVQAILSYPKMLEDSHYIGLIEREKEALAIFYKEKEIIDLFHQS